MHYKKHEVRRYVVRTRLFALRDPRRNAAGSATVVGAADKPASSDAATAGKRAPKE